MIVRRARFGQDPLAPADPAAPADQVDVSVKPATVATGIGVWVTAGVLTHLAIRFIDAVLDHRKKRE